MAKHGRGGAPVEARAAALQPPRGSVRACMTYRGEMLRNRVITADGLDFVVTTSAEVAPRTGFVTAAYPVQQGYLVMVRQPLCELRSSGAEPAREQHEQLVRVLAEAGVQVVRARRSLAARRHAERAEARAADDSAASAAWLLEGAGNETALSV